MSKLDEAREAVRLAQVQLDYARMFLRDLVQRAYEAGFDVGRPGQTSSVRVERPSANEVKLGLEGLEKAAVKFASESSFLKTEERIAQLNDTRAVGMRPELAAPYTGRQVLSGCAVRAAIQTDAPVTFSKWLASAGFPCKVESLGLLHTKLTVPSDRIEEVRAKVRELVPMGVLVEVVAAEGGATTSNT